MIDQHFVEDQAYALAHKALEFISKPKARGEKPPLPSKALASASWATRLGTKFNSLVLRKNKKRALAILKDLLKKS